MQTAEILLLATVVLALLGGLVALGVGHRRWNIGTVVAGFLVLLAAAAFLYLAARVANRDRAWARKIADYEARIARAEHDVVDPQAAGWEEGPDSLPRMQARRDHWLRGLDRVENWRGRVWRDAAFQPPKDDASPGRLELAAEQNAETAPPFAVGAHVFLFDSAPYEEGGVYVGEFLVQAARYDQDSKRHVLDVVQTARRDAYDAKVLARPHDSVMVFEDLPVDRWLAFYRSRPRGEATTGVLPEPTKEDAEKVRELLESSPQVGAMVERFVETFRQHEEEVAKEDWEQAEREAVERPGTLWAEVEFTKPHSFAGEGAAPGDAAAGDAGPKRDFEPGERIEFDLQTAVELRDGPQVVTISRIVRRRPLTDALTLLHGATGVDGAGADGTSSLRRLLQAELAALDDSNRRLQAAQAAAIANADDERKIGRELQQDLESWRRDARAADELAAGFERELAETTRALRAAEDAIVTRGRELVAAMARLKAEVDRVAPPPERRGALP